MVISNKLCVKVFLYALISLTIIFPSGSILGFNYKIIFLFFCFLFLFLHLLTSKVPVGIYLALFVFFVFLGCYSFVALVNQVKCIDLMSHSIAILSLFCIIFLSITLTYINHKNGVALKRLIVFSVAIYSALKLLICFLIGIEFFSPDSIQSFLRYYFNFEFIGLDAGYFYRIHIPIDFLLPLVFLYLNQAGDKFFSPLIKSAINVVVLFAILISYSRLLYFIFFVVLLLLFFSFLKNKKIIKRFIYVLLGGMVLLLVLYFAMDFFVERYSGKMAEASDGPRMEMYTALVDIINTFPLLGKGLGGSSDSLIRFVDMPWYYELQWLSFVAQFGVVGFFVILGLALLPVFMVLFRRVTYFSFSVLIVYFLWLGVGVFNGFMLTSSAGVIFLFFMLLLFDFNRHSCFENNGIKRI